MLEAFDLFNSLNMVSDFSDFIHFETRKPQGTEHFYGLVHAIKNKFTVGFNHKKFLEDEITTRTIEPYFMKESKNRWYVVGRDFKDAKIKSFGLERISNLEIKRQKFVYPKNFDAKGMYKYSFGIIHGADEKPQEIVLSFTREQGKYLNSLPLHSTQRMVLETVEEIQIHLTVRITHDFLMELLSYSNEMTVVKPLGLRRKLKKMLKEGIERNT